MFLCCIGAYPSLRSDSCKLGLHFHIRNHWIKLLETPRLINNLTHHITAGLLCSITTVPNNGPWTSSSLHSECNCCSDFLSQTQTYSFPCVGQEWGRMVQLIWCKSLTLPFVSLLPRVLVWAARVVEFLNSSNFLHCLHACTRLNQMIYSWLHADVWRLVQFYWIIFTNCPAISQALLRI